MKTFCCGKFKSYYENGVIQDGEFKKEVFPNLKIVKTEIGTGNEGTNLYRYLFVCGFLKDKPPTINLKYCPFCGENLYEYYNNDLYINEESKRFF
jgi:hypothetical protein